MKTVLSIILVFSLTHILAQDITFPAETDTIEIVAKLFEGEINDEGVCVWKPNLAEKLQFGVNEYDEGLLYTRIYAVFVYDDNKFQNVLIIVTYTNKSLDEGGGCHACGPIMSVIELNRIDSTYHLKAFYKYIGKFGSWGQPDAVGLLKIADDDFCINNEGWDTGQGYTYETTTLYYEGTNILRFTSHEDNEGAAGVEGDAYEYNTSMVVDSKKGKLTLHKKGTERNGGKVVMVDEVTRYEFIDGRFVKMCN